jgi:hypothetical protein
MSSYNTASRSVTLAGKTLYYQESSPQQQQAQFNSSHSNQIDNDNNNDDEDVLQQEYDESDVSCYANILSNLSVQEFAISF